MDSFVMDTRMIQYAFVCENKFIQVHQFFLGNTKKKLNAKVLLDAKPHFATRINDIRSLNQVRKNELLFYINANKQQQKNNKSK